MREEHKPPRAESDHPDMRAFRRIATLLSRQAATRSMQDGDALNQALELAEDPRLQEQLRLDDLVTMGYARVRPGEVFDYVSEWGLFWGSLPVCTPDYDLLRLGMVERDGIWRNTSAGYYVAGSRQSDELIPFVNETLSMGRGTMHDKVRPVTVGEHTLLMDYLAGGAAIV